MTCSDDSCHRIWRVGLEHRIENEETEIRGQAEIVVEKYLEKMKLETTPTTSRCFINYETTPGSDNTSGNVKNIAVI